MAEALAFPAALLPAWLETPGLSQFGVGLRTAEESDLSFLRGSLCGIPRNRAGFCAVVGVGQARLL